MEETKNLLKGIINDLVNPNAKLEHILLKTKVLAYDLHFNRLKDWIEAEINGYQNITIPKYRVIDAELRGQVLKGITIYNSYPLPVIELALHRGMSAEEVKELITVKFNQSIAEIESWLQNAKDKTHLKISLPYHICSYFNEILENAGLNQGWKLFSINSLSQILASVRDKLLTFLLELRNEIGLKDAFIFEKEQTTLNTLFEKTISNVIVIGENNQILQGVEQSQIAVN